MREVEPETTRAISEMGNTDNIAIEAISKYHFRMAPDGREDTMG
jgi:hypothetical protein